ncbi:MAG: hypothetical protein B7X11_06495 [Acidobacteria bacterium 37-65-4]|nr:MAG: hypothetical protein B7X11_06495 [Acidobacteria bacterium 37-65-4]
MGGLLLALACAQHQGKTEVQMETAQRIAKLEPYLKGARQALSAGFDRVFITIVDGVMRT